MAYRNPHPSMTDANATFDASGENSYGSCGVTPFRALTNAVSPF
jgi:hypothetical protein